MMPLLHAPLRARRAGGRGRDVSNWKLPFVGKPSESASDPSSGGTPTHPRRTPVSSVQPMYSSVHVDGEGTAVTSARQEFQRIQQPSPWRGLALRWRRWYPSWTRIRLPIGARSRLSSSRQAQRRPNTSPDALWEQARAPQVFPATLAGQTPHALCRHANGPPRRPLRSRIRIRAIDDCMAGYSNPRIVLITHYCPTSVSLVREHPQECRKGRNSLRGISCPQ